MSEGEKDYSDNEEEVKAKIRRKHPLSLLIMDIDGLDKFDKSKYINNYIGNDNDNIDQSLLRLKNIFYFLNNNN